MICSDKMASSRYDMPPGSHVLQSGIVYAFGVTKTSLFSLEVRLSAQVLIQWWATLFSQASML